MKKNLFLQVTLPFELLNNGRAVDGIITHEHLHSCRHYNLEFGTNLKIYLTDCDYTCQKVF